jgi:hypothetical protein
VWEKGRAKRERQCVVSKEVGKKKVGQGEVERGRVGHGDKGVVCV